MLREDCLRLCFDQCFKRTILHSFLPANDSLTGTQNLGSWVYTWMYILKDTYVHVYHVCAKRLPWPHVYLTETTKRCAQGGQWHSAFLLLIKNNRVTVFPWLINSPGLGRVLFSTPPFEGIIQEGVFQCHLFTSEKKNSDQKRQSHSSPAQVWSYTTFRQGSSCLHQVKEGEPCRNVV